MINYYLFYLISGEVERLLKEYRQNQEMVRKIGSHSYQIIYPVQLRHHEKMGISTREVGAAKVRYRIHKRNSNNNTVCFKFLILHPSSCFVCLLIMFILFDDCVSKRVIMILML